MTDEEDNELVNSGYTVDDFTEEAQDEAPQEQTIETQSVPHKERRKKQTSNRRVEELLYRNGTLEQQSSFLSNQLAQESMAKEEAIRENHRLQQLLQAAGKQNDSYFEQSLESEESKLNQLIKHAKEEGDIDKEIQLINELADVKSRKTTHTYAQYQNELRKQEQLQNEPYVPIETYLPQPQQQAPKPYVSEAFEDWRYNNRWYDSSPDLRQEADAIGMDLMNRLKFNGREEIIDTPQFYESVSNIMNDRYGLNQSGNSNDREQQEYAQEEPYSQSYANPVAPVTRRGPSMADQYVQNHASNSLRSLSKEEYAIARHLPIRNRGESDAKLVERYQKGKNYPKSPLPGGTQYRLTIV